MRVLPPLVARAGLATIILLGSLVAAAGAIFATGPAGEAARGTTPESLSATLPCSSETEDISR